MNRFFVVALTLCLGILSAAGQSTTVTIKGKVVDKADGSPLIGAFIKLNAADTAGLKKSGRMVASSENGAFTIISHEKKSDITISYLGYAPIKIDIPAGKKLVELGNINLIEEGRQIGAVVVTGKATMGKNEADTIQYNAAAFKTNPDGSAEDLLKKMPGVTTDESGNVQSQGQKIAKVMVNGKEYFDDDPAMALKNLPVDAVESMQMYDDQSEQSKFSGFDDGQRVRTLNIVTKKGVMNSTFGKVYAGYGLNGQYTAGAGVNMMRDNHRITIVAQSNNVNNQGFTLNDIGQGASGGRGRMGGGGNNAGAFTTSSRGGIMQTNMAAINYNGQFAEKLKLSASYSFSGRSADQVSTRKQNYLVQPRYYQQGASSLGYEYQHRLFARAEWSPNQANKITFTPRVNYALNHGISTNVSSTSTAKEGTLTNSSKNSYDTKYESYDLSGDLWWQTRLGKAGRVLSLGTVLSGKKNWGDRYQNSLYGSLDDASAWVPDSLKQRGYIDGSEYTITGSATYTEPLSKRSRLSANYTINHNKSMSNREGWNWDKQEQDYRLLDTTTTNVFARNYTTHVAGLAYGYNIDKTFSLTASINYQYAALGSIQDFPQIALPAKNYSFQSWQPSLRINYNPSKLHSLSFEYSTYSAIPSVSQLQDVWDVTNILQVSVGNSALKQSYNNNVSLRYNYANQEKNVNFNLFLNGTYTTDYIANHRYFLPQEKDVNGTIIPKGAQVSTPVNLNGYYNLGMYSTVSVGVKAIKSNVNVSLYYRMVQSPSLEDFVAYSSLSNSIGTRISLTSNISEKVDFTLSYDPSVRLSNASTGRFDRYFSHNLSAFLNVFLVKGLFVNLDASWRNNFGTQESYSQHFALLNAAIGYKLLGNRLEIKVSGYDLLNQNRSYRQSATDTYIMETTSNVLQRYFMASLMWKFDTRKGSNSLSNNRPEQRGMMMRPH